MQPVTTLDSWGRWQWFVRRPGSGLLEGHAVVSPQAGQRFTRRPGSSLLEVRAAVWSKARHWFARRSGRDGRKRTLLGGSRKHIYHRRYRHYEWVTAVAGCISVCVGPHCAGTRVLSVFGRSPHTKYVSYTGGTHEILHRCLETSLETTLNSMGLIRGLPLDSGLGFFREGGF